MKCAFTLAFLSSSLLSNLLAQPTICTPSAVPTIVHFEGLTERIGDIVYNCTGVPSASITGNLSISLNTNLTNRISAGNLLTGIVATADNGSGPQPVLTPALLSGQNMVLYNGVSLPLSPQGRLSLRIAGIRANANRVPLNASIMAFLAGDVPLTSTQLVVGTSERGLYAAFSEALVCAQSGSSLPATLDFSSLVHGSTAFATTRITEGFVDAFATLSAPANLNADSGDRIIVRYSGFPHDARLFVPSVVAGSTAVHPTGGGDFEVPASGGSYVRSASGSLLLALVSGANANGAGGTPVFNPAGVGSATVAFNDVSELSIVNGAAVAVYEVMDSNPDAIETAQFPTFLGLPPDGNRTASEPSTEVFFAPLSTVADASSTEPLPRFAAVKPPVDCGIIGDCATYLPHLTVDRTSFDFTGSTPQQGYFTIRNTGGGRMPWTASIAYTGPTGWLSLDVNSANDGGNVRLFVVPGTVAPGTYHATITIDGGTVAGTAAIPVTLTVTAPPAPATTSTTGSTTSSSSTSSTSQPQTPVPTITAIVNSASSAPVPVVAGSLTTLLGSAFAGNHVVVTFDSLPATMLYASDSQINLVVPAELSAKTSAQLVISVDGVNSSPKTVTLAPFEPAIFTGAILNPDLSVNQAAHGAAAGSIIALWATGLSGSGSITAHIHDRDINLPIYAGPAPGLSGVQQVNFQIPADLPAMTTDLYVCGTAADPAGKTCSLPARVTIAP